MATSVQLCLCLLSLSLCYLVSHMLIRSINYPLIIPPREGKDHSNSYAFKQAFSPSIDYCLGIDLSTIPNLAQSLLFFSLHQWRKNSSPTSWIMNVVKNVVWRIKWATWASLSNCMCNAIMPKTELEIICDLLRVRKQAWLELPYCC